MLVRYGGGILDARGSIGGQVHSRNRYGAYVRARTKPVNPQSPLQSAIRSVVSSVAQRWFSALTQANRDAWSVFASNVPAKNKLGETINLSGYNQFCKSNIAAISNGQVDIDDAPVLFTLPGEDATFAVVASEAAQTLAITFDDTRDWLNEDNGAMIIRMGIPQNDSIAFFGGPWRNAGVVQGDSTTPPVTGDTVPAPFEVTAGQKVWVEGKILREDGRLSDWFRFSGDCAA